MPRTRTDFGFTSRETALLRRLSPPWRVQEFLDSLDYDLVGKECRSPRRVMRERIVQCMDGALFAAAALRMHGHPPLLVSLQSVQDDDHVLAVYRQFGRWGAVTRSNFSGLRFREPVFPTLRALALSYFESYFNLRREKTLRRYSRTFDLSRFDDRAWMTTEGTLWWIGERLALSRHHPLVTPRMVRALGRVDRRLFEAGLVGRVLR